MPTREELARAREAGAPDPAAEPPAPVAPVRLDNDKRYLRQRESAYTPQKQIDTLEKELGINQFGERDLHPVAPPAPPPEAPGIWDSVVKGLKDMPAQIPAGALNAFNELGNGLLDAADWAENRLAEHGIGSGNLVPEERAHGFGNMLLGEPDTLAGRMTNSVAQFATGFLISNKAMQGAKILQGANGALKIVQGLAAGGATDFGFFDPHQERLSNLIQEHPQLANPITAFLASDPKDTETMGRVKNALEGMGLGVATEGLLASLKAYRGWKGMSGAVADEVRAGAEAAPGVPVKNPVATASTDAATTAASERGVISESDRALQESAAAKSQAAQGAQDIAAFEKTGQQPPATSSAAPAANAEASAGSAAGSASADQAALQAVETPAEKAAATSAKPAVAYDYEQQKWVTGPEAEKLGNKQINQELDSLDAMSPEQRAKHFESVGKPDMPGETAADLTASYERMSAERKAALSGAAPEVKAAIESVPRGTTESVTPPAMKLPAFEVGGEAPMSIVSGVAKNGQAVEAKALVDATALELPGKMAVNINLNKINASTDLKAMISQVAEKFGPEINAARRGKMSESTMASLANDLNMTVEDLAKRQTGQALNAEQLLASRAVLNASAENLLQKARLASGIEASDIDRAAFLNALEAHKAIQAQVSGAVAEAGRALRSQNMIVGLPTDAQKMKAITETIKAFGGGGSVSDMARALGEMKDVKSISQVLQKSMSRKIGDAIYEVWINGLLSGAKTFTVNIGSNTAVMFGKIGERYLGEGLGLLKAGARNNLNADRVVLGEANAMVNGMINGLWDGYRMVKHAITERIPIDQYTQVPTARGSSISAEAFGLTGPIGRAVDYMGMMVRWPGKGQMLADKFFQAVNYRMELQALAHREASYRGLEGEEFKNFVDDILANPPDELRFKSTEEARLNTFTNERGDFSENLINTVHSHPVGRVVLPFLRTNFNMAEYAAQRIPGLHLLSPQMRADMAAGGARADLAQAKLAFGGSLMAATAALAANGAITGHGPKDPKALEALKSTGWRPNSVKIGDTYYSYNRVEPFGTVLGMAADWTELAGHAFSQGMDAADVALSAAATAANISSAENLVESVVQFGDFVTDPEKNAKKYLSNLGASIVPAWLRQFDREGGDVKRNTSATTYKLDASQGRYVKDDNIFQETLNRIRASIPGYSEGLPAQRNMFGEVSVYDPGVGPDIASPIYASKTVQSPIRDEMAQLSLNGKGFEMPNEFITTKVGAIPLTPVQYEKYVELSAGIGLKKESGLKRSLEDELNYQVKNNFPSVAVNPKLKQLPEWRYAMIKDIIGKYRKAASIQMIAEEFSDDLQGKYNALKGVKEEAVTGRKSVSFTPPGGGTTK